MAQELKRKLTAILSADVKCMKRGRVLILDFKRVGPEKRNF